MNTFKFFNSYNFKSPTNWALQGHWVPQIINDLHTHHGINVEEELTNVLNEELRRTIDEQIILPLSQRITAQTIGLDLVTVQPLGGPVGVLHYLDFNNNKKLLNTFKFLT